MSDGRHGPAALLSGSVLQKRLLASLIVCVALLTQFGASLWGAAAARDGIAGCHRSIAWSETADASSSGAPDRAIPAQAPSKPDHACCSLCELSFGFFHGEAPVFETRSAAFRRVLLAEPQALRPPTVLNRSAPARAPPSPA